MGKMRQQDAGGLMCPWCNIVLLGNQGKEFQRHVYKRHGFFLEDIIAFRNNETAQKARKKLDAQRG